MKERERKVKSAGDSARMGGERHELQSGSRRQPHSLEAKVGSMHPLIRVCMADPQGPVGASLLAELAAFYEERYGVQGFGAFPVERLTVPGAAFVVAWQFEQPVGCGAFLPMEEPHCAEIKRMFVRTGARRQGVAQAILAALENLAREYGYTTIRLETGKRVPEAVRLYDSAAYARIPCWGDYAEREESVCFEKSL